MLAKNAMTLTLSTGMVVAVYALLNLGIRAAEQITQLLTLMYACNNNAVTGNLTQERHVTMAMSAIVTAVVRYVQWRWVMSAAG